MIPKSNEFDLLQTLDCGQSFRWEPCNGKSNRIGGIAFGRYLELEEVNDHILFCDTAEDEFLHIWVPYFDLELDYKAIKDNLSKLDPILCKAAQYAPGIRILQQDPWEALCCFCLLYTSRSCKCSKSCTYIFADNHTYNEQYQR